MPYLNAVQPLAANRQQWEEHTPRPQDYLPPSLHGPYRLSLTDNPYNSILRLRTLRSPPPWCFKSFTSRKLRGERLVSTNVYADCFLY